MSDVDEVKTKLNIVDIVADYVQLKKAGASYKARCPFHQERTPSFNVSPTRQIFHCFGCGKGGDVIEFVMQIEGIDFPAALKQLADRAGVTLQLRLQTDRWNIKGNSTDEKALLYRINDFAARYYHKVLSESPKAEKAREYLKKRNFTARTLAEWQIGYSVESWDNLVGVLRKKGFSDRDIVASGVAGKNQQGKLYDRFRDRIMFPIYENSWGKILGFSARILNPKEGVGKYINTPETGIYSKSKIIYGFYQAKQPIRKEGFVIVVEGNVDVIKSHQIGIGNIVASSGTAFTDTQRTTLKRLSEKLVFAFDNDEAGKLAAHRAMVPEIEAGFETYVAILPEGFKDADEVIDTDPKLWQASIAKASDFIDFDREARFATLGREDSNIYDAAFREHLSLIALVPNSVKAEEYCAKLSRKTGNSISAIVRQYNDIKRARLASGSRHTSKPAASGSQNRSPSSHLERWFIGLLLLLGERSYKFYELHEPQEFTSPELSQLYEALKFQFLSTHKVSIENLSTVGTGLTNLANRLVYAVESADPGEIDPIRELEALSERMRYEYFSRRQEMLTRRIAAKEAEKSNVDGLRQEFDELAKQKYQLLVNSESYGKKEESKR